MTKKAIIFVMLLLFLNSIIFPNFASAMGQSSSVSDAAGVGLLVGFVVVGIVYYYYKKTPKEPKEDKKENKLTKEKIGKRITQSGEFVLLRW
jgi:Ca2+/Na+ antiporter